ncbi:MAG: insulinase family protein, partial [Muribaculaceae bacterium]
MPMENPKATVYCTIGGDIKPSLKNSLALQMLSAVMDINYVKTIREEEGGTYGVGTYGTIIKANDTWKFIYKFDTNIESQERLNKRAMSELVKAMTEGLDDTAFSQVKENFLKRFETNVRKNNYWLSILNDRALYGTPDNNVEEYGKMLKKITKSDIEKILKKLYNKNNKIVIVLDGKAKNK